MHGQKRRRTGPRDVWIEPEVTKLNQQQLRIWNQKPVGSIESNRFGALQELYEQDRSFLGTSVAEWLQPECKLSAKRHSDGNPIDCDVLIIRPHPCKPSLCNPEGTEYIENGFAADHKQFIDRFHEFGLTGRRIFSLYYCPYYMTDKKFRGLSTKNAREILGWRMLIALWLIRPKFILGTDHKICKLIASKFDSRKFESEKKPINHGVVRSLRIKGPTVIRGAQSIVVKAMKIEHPYLFSPSNKNPTTGARETFKKVTECLLQWLKEDETTKSEHDKTPMYVRLLQNAIGPVKSEPIDNTNEEEKEDFEQRVMCPAWITVDHWNLFLKPKDGACMCTECGGCGAEQKCVTNLDLFDHTTLYPRKDCYSVEWTVGPNSACDYCQCKHGHRTLGFNECMKGCPVSSTLDEIYESRHTVTERFSARDFTEKLITDASYFRNTKMNEMMAK